MLFFALTVMARKEKKDHTNHISRWRANKSPLWSITLLVGLEQWEQKLLAILTNNKFQTFVHEPRRCPS